MEVEFQDAFAALFYIFSLNFSPWVTEAISKRWPPLPPHTCFKSRMIASFLLLVAPRIYLHGIIKLRFGCRFSFRKKGVINGLFKLFLLLNDAY